MPIEVIIRHTCDECGAKATYMTFLDTGRVIIDHKDVGQDAFLCDLHKPLSALDRQPHMCQRTRWYWSAMPEWNVSEEVHAI